ncbi:uncharacterized [Tachysurus ichikawai]
MKEERDGRTLCPFRADACLLNFVRAPPKSAVSEQGSMRSAFDWMSLAVIRRRGTDPRRCCARTEHQAAAKKHFLGR